jgi:uncharacterized protein (DUF1778 family)
LERVVTSQSPVLSVRISPAERDLLKAAADQAGASLSDFVRRKALEAAELEVLNRTVVSIPAELWEQAEEWVAAPPREIPALRKLASHKPAWRA